MSWIETRPPQYTLVCASLSCVNVLQTVKVAVYMCQYPVPYGTGTRVTLTVQLA